MSHHEAPSNVDDVNICVRTPQAKAMQNTERARLVRMYRLAILESYIPHSPLPVGLAVLPNSANRWSDSMTKSERKALCIGGDEWRMAGNPVLPLVSWTELNQNLQEQLVARVFICDTRGRVIWNGKWNFTSDKWEDWSLTLYRRDSKEPRAHLNHLGFGWSEIPRLPKLVVGYHGIDAAGALKMRLHKLGYKVDFVAAKTYPTVTELRYGVASNVGKKGNVVGWSSRQDTVGVPPPLVHHMHHDVPQWEDDEPIIGKRHSVSFEVTDITKLPSAFTRAVRDGSRDAPTRELPVDKIYDPASEARYLLNGKHLPALGVEASVRQKDTDAKFRLAVQQYLKAEYVAKRNGGTTQGLHLRYTRMLPVVSDAQLQEVMNRFALAGVVYNPIIEAIKKELDKRA